jgi:uncharacterized ferritin-like protein (DUF455 family)
MSAPAADLRSFCRRVLEAGDLASKLAPPLDGEGHPLADDDPGAPLSIDAPARDPELALVTGAARLPRPGELADAAARATCLARFAHHELMAVELFAWALLRWPDLPSPLRRALAAVLAEEQIHCRLYLERLAAHGSQLGDHALSGYFWRHAPAIAQSPHGARAFLAGMGLTLEQANLDFAGLYRDALRAAGDEESARVCERVHADEIGHVALAARWLARLDPAVRLADGHENAAYDEIAGYETCVPFPLSAARAKGRRFDAAARRRAGLSEAFIEHVRLARSSAERTRGAEPASS